MRLILKYCIILGFVLPFSSAITNLWTCDDGAVIELSKVCDGETDCSDSTDETSLYCKKYVCDSGYFQCSYGACVKNVSNCRGMIKKDKKPDPVATLISSSCRITKIPANGFVQYLYSPGVYLKVDEMVANLVKVQIMCIPNHRIEGSDSIACRNGTWDGSIPECHSFCPLILSSVTFSINCSLNNVNVNCTEPAKAGTMAIVTCNYGYENNINATTQHTICGTDGKWQPEPSPCTQTCGERVEHVSGEFKGTTILQAPWHVSIYKRLSVDRPFEPICGGSIVNAKVVVSAAHCFWDETEGALSDVSLFQIKTGKSFQEYDDGKDIAQVQSFSIDRLEKHITFYGWRSSYKDDIITIVLNSYIEFNMYTAPICIDYSLIGEDKFVSPGLKGLMGIWGHDEALSKSSLTLKIIELSVIMQEECQNNSPEELLNILTNDKFCTKRLSPDSGVCEGNSGNGLVFPIEINGKIKYFLRGVAVESPWTVNCDLKSYLTFESVAHFSSGIWNLNVKYKPIETFTYYTESAAVTKTIPKECTLTEIPANGFVSYLNHLNTVVTSSSTFYHLLIGQGVANFVVLRYSCHDNYSLKGKRTNLCLDGAWTNSAPKCFIDRDALAKHWKCDDGKIIETSKVCNGEADCSDYSDETSNICQNYVCGKGHFQCTYGACVTNETNCRVITENDESDQVIPNSCRITKIPSNGYVRYSISPDTHLKVNEIIPNHVSIQFTCADKYRIVGNEMISCQNGDWNGVIPECEAYCPPIASSVTFAVNCTFNIESVNCMEATKPGTVATVTCKYGYKSDIPQQQTICRANGKWQPVLSPCEQKCGERTIGSANITQVPWHATIYKRSTSGRAFEPICGGTILNAKIVISAAHCFWDHEKLRFHESTEFRIKTGKSFKGYDNDRADTNVQSFSLSQVKEISLFYGVENGYRYDMTILVLDKYIEFNPYTFPICIDYNLKFNGKYVSPGLKGLVAGWGLDETSGEPGSSLKAIELSVIPREKCKNESPEEFLSFLTVDKFCAEKLSGGVTLCPSDSGSGLAFPITEDGETKYFFRGVATFSPTNGTCDTRQYLTFENVAHFTTHFSRDDNQYRPTHSLTHRDLDENLSVRCIIDEIPKYGFVVELSTSAPLDLGFEAFNLGTYQYFCNDNYTLKGNPTNNCLDGEWTDPVPECIPFSTGLNTDCRALPTPRNGHIQYFTNDGFLLGSNKGEKFYGSGTSAKINCLTGFEVSGGAQQALTCDENGRWFPDLKDVTCRPICGKQASEGTAYIVGGQGTNITYAPWHVAIFKVKDDTTSYHCGGTILTEQIVISAMHCFWDRRVNSAYNANLFKVAAGKQYSDFNSTNEPYPVQHFDITDLNYYSDYRDLSGNFALDIVLLLLNDTINFQHHIAPVCVQLNTVTIHDIPVHPGLTGTLAGWGLTKSGGIISESLKIVDLPTVERDKCIVESGYGFQDFVTVDKFCAGHLKLDISACQGDSGGGLVFPEMVKGTRRYFLRGIVSVGANSLGSCDSSKYTTFTNVIYHDKFIRTALIKPQ